MTRWLTAAMIVASLLAAREAAAQAPKNKGAKLDFAKVAVEAGAEQLLAETRGTAPPAEAPPPRDAPKVLLESGAEKLVKKSRRAAQLLEQVDVTKQVAQISRPRGDAAPTRQAKTGPVPRTEPTAEKVRPGMVDWHDGLAAARAAAAKSGKPILLFQLMGQLDERFT